MTKITILRVGGRMAICGLALLLAGCGLTQRVADGTVRVTKAIFYKQINVLHLDFAARAAMNADGEQIPHATMVRIYQLRDRKNFDTANYAKLLGDADSALNGEVLASREVLLLPAGNLSLTMPMEAEAQFVAVVALFQRPVLQNDQWRVVLSRNELDPDKPRRLALGDGWISLLPPEK